jgi:hypothetical protein
VSGDGVHLTGPEHRRIAELHAHAAGELWDEGRRDEALFALKRALVHATLADPGRRPPGRRPPGRYGVMG